MNPITYYSPNRFEKLPDGWIRDNMPGNEREWGPSSPTILGPEKRKKFCEEHGGSEPEAHEAASIVNYEVKRGFFQAFTDTKTNNCYATKTKVAWGRSLVRVVCYGSGNVYCNDKGDRYYVRPVRLISSQKEINAGIIPIIDADSLKERIAQLTAHRACCGSEHNPAEGKLHGYCVVCGVPWPCSYAGKPPGIKE